MSPVLCLALLAVFASAAAAGAVACTSASAVDEDATNGIYGSWVSTGASDGKTVRLSLTSARTYSLEELTVSTTGATWAHAETGTFTASTGVIDWSPEQSTCPGPEATYQSAYELSGTTFSLALPGDVVALRALADEDEDEDDAGAGASLTLGCFGADGGFTTSPLSAVSP